jgi:O-methyltransferase involved in polyketide biosynthesis
MSLDLKSVSETLWIPLFGKAIETKRPNGLIADQKALEVANKAIELRPELGKWWRALSRESQGLMIWRTFEIDAFAKEYIDASEQPVVVNLGAGLCTRFERMKAFNPDLKWIEIDLPPVKEAWKNFNKETSDHQYWTDSVFENEWLQKIRDIKSENVLFIAEGLFMYFSKEEVNGILNRIAEVIPHSHVIMEVYSKFALLRPHPDVLRTGAKKFDNPWGVRTGKDFEKWSDKLKHHKDSYFLKHKKALRRVPVSHQIGSLMPFIAKAGKIVYLKTI